MAATEEAIFSFYMQRNMVLLWGKEETSEQIQNLVYINTADISKCYLVFIYTSYTSYIHLILLFQCHSEIKETDHE